MVRKYSRVFGLLFLAAFSGVLFATSIPTRTVEAESDALATQSQVSAVVASSIIATEDDFKPVDNMHHFMEYVYGPVYKDLTAALKTEPADKEGWARVKSGAMILAESSSLLSKRSKEKADASKWSEFSAIVHSNGSKLFHAARAKDFAKSQKLFKEMSTGCAKCHESFQK